MTVPIRIQRQRTRGWKKPPNTVCVTRGCLWGNPFIVRPDLPPGSKIGWSGYYAVPTAQDAVETYREYLKECPDLIEKARRTLRGKNLACWCGVEEPFCHADVLLEVANAVK